jgi:release factor glutamine methyltransferase
VTIAEALRDGEAFLAERGIETARVDAELLLGKVLGLTRTELYADGRSELAEPQLEEYRTLLDRRGGREPAAYTLGEWGFRRLTLGIDSRVLVPRPETETVVERSLALLRESAAPEVLDAGTGSGAIALAIADEHPGARVTGFDSSPAALEVARENASLTGLEERVRLVEHDLADGLDGLGSYDLVVSNPPYVREEELAGLEPEVRDFEPRAALVDAGQTEAVARAALDVLKPGGHLVLEAAAERAGEVASLLEGLGYEDVLVTRDEAGAERVVEGRRA